MKPRDVGGEEVLEQDWLRILRRIAFSARFIIIRGGSR